MASKKKTLRKKAARHAKVYAEYDMRNIKDTLDNLVAHGIVNLKYDPFYKKLSKDDKYWHRCNIERLGEEVKAAIDAALDEVVRSQSIARISTDEAIQSNIEANMYKNMLGDREKDISGVARIMKNSLHKRVRKRNEEKHNEGSKAH